MSEVNKKKVFVGLSGGVDSSVSAALLLRDGYEVVGVFIKVWQADFLPCTWREERREAMRAAAHLGIPFVTLDLERAYKEEVVDYMIREYGAGRIPNPDVMCNKYVKFGSFLEYAKAHGADFIATGHYAQIFPASEEDTKETTHAFALHAGVDSEKDQSYFLWTLTQHELSSTLFPVGHLEKREVRELAHAFGLPNAEKKDSQGLCFMGAVDMSEFLKHYLKTSPGNVLGENGEIVGRHEGALLYTIGQRHGFTTEKKSANEAPYFVIAKDIAANTVSVAHRDPDDKKGKSTILILKEVNSIAQTGALPESMLVRIRYRGELIAARFVPNAIQGGTLTLGVATEGVATGQSVVFYREAECLGGGVIDHIAQ